MASDPHLAVNDDLVARQLVQTIAQFVNRNIQGSRNVAPGELFIRAYIDENFAGVKPRLELVPLDALGEATCQVFRKRAFQSATVDARLRA